MQIKEYLNIVCEQIKYKPIREDISNELKNHIEEIKEDYISKGETEIVAEEKAIEQMGDGETIGKNLNKIHRPKFDWLLAIFTIILLGFGILVAFFKTQNSEQTNYIIKFVKYMIVGLIFGVGIYFVDFKKIQKHSNIIYFFGLSIMILNCFSSVYVNGLKYLSLFGNKFSGSVISIPLFIISFIGMLENKSSTINLNKDDKFNIIFNVKWFKIIILSLISIGAILINSTLPATIILCLSYLFIVTVKFILERRSKLLVVLLWGIPLLLSLIFGIYLLSNSISRYRFNRIQTFFNPESDPQGSGWLMLKRREIINSAKLFGSVNDFSYIKNLIDEGTEFSFISILAHCGWIVSLGLILAIIAFNLKIILDSNKVKDNFGRLLIIGISILFILQSVFNVLVNLNLFIESGFNLPFISYGGINLIVNIICLSLVFSIYRRKDILLKKDVSIENTKRKSQIILKLEKWLFEEPSEE